MAVKNTAQVVIGGKIITLGGYESEEYFQKVTSYINNLRLEKSKALLKEHSVKEVATLVGFESTNYFSRALRKKYGVSPSASFNKKAASPPSNTD